MSWRTPYCDRCHVPMRFHGVYRYDGGLPLYGVAWRCDACDHSTLDTCPLPPEEPSAGHCLNCHSALEAARPCTGCGLAPGRIDAMVTGLPGDTLLEKAAQASAQGLLRLAFNAIDMRLAQHPDDAEAWENKARLLQSLGYLEASQFPLRKAADHGETAATWISLGYAYAETERYQEALEAYQRYLDDPDSDTEMMATAWSNRGNALGSLGDLPSAEQAHRQAVALSPRASIYRCNHAASLRGLGRQHEAIATLSEALSLAANEAERTHVLELRAETYCELERGEEGLADIEHALAQAPESVTRRYTFGRALALVGRLEEALRAMESVLELHPEHEAALRARSMIAGALDR